MTQGEGREQGDVLMPVPYSLGQHGALQSVASHLLPGKRLFAFLDDVYVLCALPSCTASCVLPSGISHAFESAPGRRSCGIEQGWSLLGASISQLRHVWQTPQLVSGMEQKMFPNISATPLGHPEFVVSQLQATVESHHTRLNRIPCRALGSCRCFVERREPTTASESFIRCCHRVLRQAARHDASI